MDDNSPVTFSGVLSCQRLPSQHQQSSSTITNPPLSSHSPSLLSGLSSVSTAVDGAYLLSGTIGCETGAAHSVTAIDTSDVTLPSFSSSLQNTSSEADTMSGVDMDLVEETKEICPGIKVRAGKLNKLVEILIDSFGRIRTFFRSHRFRLISPLFKTKTATYFQILTSRECLFSCTSGSWSQSLFPACFMSYTTRMKTTSPSILSNIDYEYAMYLGK